MLQNYEICYNLSVFHNRDYLKNYEFTIKEYQYNIFGEKDYEMCLGFINSYLIETRD